MDDEPYAAGAEAPHGAAPPDGGIACAAGTAVYPYIAGPSL